MSGSKDEFKIKFRGIRGSHPVCSQPFLRYGGNTTCLEINVNGHLIVIDAGTGIIELGNDLLKGHIQSGTSAENREPIQATLLFSHTHQDHIQGFPFFKPAYIGSSQIHMFGSMCLGMDFEETLSKSMFTPFFPIDLGEMAANLQINNFKETEMLLLYQDNPKPEIRQIYPVDDFEIPHEAIVIKCLKSYAHPKDGVLLFKISWKGHSVVYASDKESYVGGDTRLAAFARNADVLIHDCQYIADDYFSLVTPKQGFGHSTPEMAVETAKLANVKQLVLSHFDPSYNDEAVDVIQEKAKKQFINSIAAHEGLEISLV